jgi:NhaP-type Na+/H+ or K+/H+ antiporter
MSTEAIMLGLVAVISTGTLAQWVAWRLKLPSILLLLLTGIAAGMTGLLNPDELMGNGLAPLVKLSVGIILFEGGLSLKMSELRRIGTALSRLMTVGLVVTWLLAAVLSYYTLGFAEDEALSLSILFGSILIVTGPTVIIPLMRQVRPSGNVASVLKWEGIVNDPIGVMFAVLVLEVILAGGLAEGKGVAILSIVNTVGYGTLLGAAGAAIMVYLLKRHLIPDFLQNPVSLALVVGTFALSDVLQHESGLWAVTVMGIILANQKYVRVKHIIEFKENLRVLLISALFVLLSARLTLEDLAHVNIGSVLFLFGLIFIVRPAAIFLSMIKTNLTTKEKLFLSWMAPRGIVAASISAIFSFSLIEGGFESASLLVPYTFIVIIGTVTIYGLSAKWVANKLNVAKPDALGVLFLGGHNWVRDMARAVKQLGFDVVIADTNAQNIRLAKRQGLNTFHGNIVTDSIPEELDIDSLGNFMALTPNHEVNTLACISFEESFDSAHVFQLNEKKSGIEGGNERGGRLLFGGIHNFKTLNDLYGSGWKIDLVKIEKETTLADIKENEDFIPLFVHRTTANTFFVVADDLVTNLEKNDRIICMMKKPSTSIPSSPNTEVD